MRAVYLTTFLLLACYKLSYAQLDSAKTAKEIIRLEQILADALPADSATWSKYLDPKWHLVDEDGNSTFRKEFLEGFKPFPKTILGHVEITRPVLTFHGDVVVIQYVADEHENAYGQQLHTTYGTMDVWYKSGDSWKLLSMEDFEIPAWPPAIKVSRTILKRYTGTYRLDADNLAAISIKNDTLFIQKNKRKPEALFAETPTVFFRKSDARGRKLFVNDAKGQPVMRERRNGQDLVWRKLSRP